MAPSPPLPSCKALLLCEEVLIEARTGRTSLIRILNRVRVEELPTNVPRCNIFLQVTDGFGSYDISVEVQNLDVDSSVFRADAPQFEIGDRLAMVNIVIPLPPIEIYNTGTYDVVVLFDGRELDRQSFQLQLVDTDEPEK